MRKYSLVTVVFEGDIELMELQAKSIRLYADPILIDEIIIINNFAVGKKPGRWEERLLKIYGHWASSVKFVESDTLIKHSDKIAGWFSQQALKLAVSNIIKNDRYVILDAKNHLIKPLTRDFFERDGKVLINGYGYEKHPLRPYLEKTSVYVGIDAPIEKFVRTSTPFIMITSVARSIVRNIEKEEQDDLNSVMSKKGLTEFFLYAAYLLNLGVLYELYCFNQPFSLDIWSWGATNIDIIADVIARAKRADSGPFITVHRGAIPLLVPNGRDMICDLWVERSLFSNTDEAFEFISIINNEN